jgi:cell division protein FtsQ
MDGGRRLLAAVTSWFNTFVERRAEARAERAARRRANSGFRVPSGLGSSLAVLFLGLSGLVGMVHGGHYERFRHEQGTILDGLARLSGFGVAHIGVTGASELSRDEVVALAGLAPKASLPFLDPNAIRLNLLRAPLIAEASVRKLYPDRLLIEIKERAPFAIWQNEGKVQMIAADGMPIEALNDPRFLRLPHVVGEDANLRVKDYVTLLAEVPELAPQIRAGTLVSSRRWTLKLINGVDVKLPEDAPGRALKAFAQLEKESGLSQRGVLSVDLRILDRVIVRLTEEAAASHAESVTQRIRKAGGKV